MLRSYWSAASPGGVRLMKWGLKSSRAGVARARTLPVRLPAILALTSVVVLLVACISCGPSRGSESKPPPSAVSSEGAGCPTHGVGGDPIPPPCASSVQSSAGSLGLKGPNSTAGKAGAGPGADTGGPTGPPIVSRCSPTSGAETGGDKVTINGLDFAGATEVDFGNARSAAMTVNSDTQITAISPVGTGTVEITVVTPEGSSINWSTDHFTYVGPSAGSST